MSIGREKRHKPDEKTGHLITMPILFEDEGSLEMGESEAHVMTVEILRNAMRDHFAAKPNYHVFSDMTVYYPQGEEGAFVSPDVMVVKLPRPLKKRLHSYELGEDGPAPFLTVEVLSHLSFQQLDLTHKPTLYAEFGVAEFIVADVTRELLPGRLLLKRLRKDGAWDDEQDPDGGITSRYGFRVVIENDGDVRVIDTATGRRYPRPSEASAAEARAHELEEKLRQTEAKLARLQKKPKK